MPRTLTASDRRSLIRLASTMPVGSPERKAILAGLNVSHPAEFLRSLDQSLDVNTRMLDEGKLDRETEKRIEGLVTYLKKTKKQLLREHPDLSSSLRSASMKVGSFRDDYVSFLSDYTTRVRMALEAEMRGQGMRIKTNATNGFLWMTPSGARHEIHLSVSPSGTRKTVVKYSMDGWRSKLESRDVTDMDVKGVAAWLWKNLPAAYKQ